MVFLNAKPINSGNAQAYLHGVRKYSIGLAERLDSGYQAPGNGKRSSVSTVGSNNNDFIPVSKINYDTINCIYNLYSVCLFC